MKPTNTILEHHLVSTNGINLHVVEAGSINGPLVVLLHGFPEYWGGWCHQIPFLAGAGYRIWAPDLRGYNLSDKPRQLSAYNLDVLVDDVKGLIDASGREKANLVAHDWGAALAWWFARLYPELLERMVILNMPHGTVMQKHLHINRRQRLRSWYFFFFQIPWLAETLIRQDNWRLMINALINSSNPGTFSEKDLTAYRRAWSQPGAMTAMINWYRALFRFPPRRKAAKQVITPTLILWGAKDKFLGSEMAEPSLDYCDCGRLVNFDESSHWIHHERPDQVNRLIVDFFEKRG